MSGNVHLNRATCVVLRQAWVDHLIGYNQINRRSTKWWRKLFFFMMSCHNSYVAARCVGDTTGRAKYRGYKERLWAPVRGAPYTNDVEEPPPPGLRFPRTLRDLQWLNVLLWTLSMASTRPIIWEINAVSVSCSLKAEKDKSGSGYIVYGCVQFNVVLYIDCFITHLFCVRILFLLSCFHALESCSIKWQSFLFVFSIFLCKLDNFCNLFHLFYSVSIFLFFFFFFDGM